MSNKELQQLEALMRQYLLNGATAESKARMVTLEQLLIRLKDELLMGELEHLWLDLLSFYPDGQSCSLTLDYVPEMGLLELWGIEIAHASGDDAWSAHWFDKPLCDARSGMWGSEIALIEASRPQSFDMAAFWAWAQSFLSFFERAVDSLAVLSGASEGVSAFTIQQPAAGLKLTAEAL